MKIKFISPKSLERNIKATIHQSGKLGFTIEASDKMELNTDKSVSIGINEEDDTDENLYLVVNKTKEQDSFPVLKAGDYYYLNTKDFFKNRKIEFKKNSVSFEINEEEIENMKVFIFKINKKERGKEDKKKETSV